jgi:hypothetical protein
VGTHPVHNISEAYLPNGPSSGYWNANRPRLPNRSLASLFDIAGKAGQIRPGSTLCSIAPAHGSNTTFLADFSVCSSAYTDAIEVRFLYSSSWAELGSS